MSSNPCRDISSVFARFEGTSNRDFTLTFTDGSKLDCYSIEGSFQCCTTDEYYHNTEPAFNDNLEDISYMAANICQGLGWDEDSEVAEITFDISGCIPVVKSFCRQDCEGNPIP